VAVVADPGRLQRTLGWSPEFDRLDAILAHALAWERRLAPAAAAVSRAS
jgi:UDP-glucose 4-epimerase